MIKMFSTEFERMNFINYLCENSGISKRKAETSVKKF